MQTERVEILLEKAAKNSIYRPDFYEEILRSRFFVIYQPDGEEVSQDGYVELKKGARLKIVEYQREDGQSIIPIFSSLEALRKSVRSTASYLEFDAKQLFEITKGASYILNPYSNYSKEFTAEEIESLLLDTVPSSSRHLIEKETKILTRSPEKIPHPLIDALKYYFLKNNIVNEAYILEVLMPERDEIPHFMICLRMKSENQSIIRNAIAVTEPFLKNNEPLDFIVITKNNEHLINERQPFFKNTLLNKIKNNILSYLLDNNERI